MPSIEQVVESNIWMTRCSTGRCPEQDVPLELSPDYVRIADGSR